MMRSLRWIANSFVILFLLTTTVTAQAAGNPGLPLAPGESSNAVHSEDDSLGPQFTTQHDVKSPADQRAEKMQEKERQKQRWLEIKKESERLLEVATELKQYVDKAGENVVSLEVIKKAEQMEKLSKDLQKKMKSSF